MGGVAQQSDSSRYPLGERLTIVQCCDKSMVSRLYHRDTGRSDFGWQMGPIVGVLDDARATD